MPGRVGVNEMQDADRPALRRLYLEARRASSLWGDAAALALEDFDAATAGELVLAAHREGRIVGFVSAWLPDNFVHLLFVAPAAVRSGVGSALLSVCLERIGRPATLKCLQANADALAFYRRYGWEIVAPGRAEDGAYFLMKLES
ncbi:MAG TPA: GNAT family N-acetyltransferase [Pelomicrobium sp.]|nr:GNAT family N-acetyltransferase [Pelomicrobium sp.]